MKLLLENVVSAITGKTSMAIFSANMNRITPAIGRGCSAMVFIY